jgi:hypothetical protein
MNQKAERDETDERVPLTVEQAMGVLDEKDGYVHTFLNPGAGMLVGADWTVEKARKCFEKHGVELAGDGATSMGHGIVAIEHGRAVFFATKSDALAQVAS